MSVDREGGERSEQADLVIRELEGLQVPLVFVVMNRVEGWRNEGLQYPPAYNELYVRQGINLPGLSGVEVSSMLRSAQVFLTSSPSTTTNEGGWATAFPEDNKKNFRELPTHIVTAQGDDRIPKMYERFREIYVGEDPLVVVIGPMPINRRRSSG